MMTLKNQPKRQQEQLEAALHIKLQQCSLLEKEHTILRAKEDALLGAIRGLEDSVAATKMLLGPPASSAGASPASSGDWSAAPDSPSDIVSAAAAAAPPAHHAGASSPGWQDPASLLTRLDAQEGRIQGLLRRLGRCSAPGAAGSETGAELYTTQLLRRATADPGRMQRYLALSLEQRAHFTSQASMRLGMLLSRRGETVLAPGGATTSQQIGDIVDELTERFLVCGLWEPPDKYLDQLCVNLDTQEPQVYPDGWWHQVAEAIGLSPEQKAALQLTWDRVKAQAAQLTAELDALQQQQDVALRARLEANQRFEEGMRQVPELQASQGAMASLLLRQQQQLLLAAVRADSGPLPQLQQLGRCCPAPSVLQGVLPRQLEQPPPQQLEQPQQVQQQQQQQAQPEFLESVLMDMWSFEVAHGTSTNAAAAAAADGGGGTAALPPHSPTVVAAAAAPAVVATAPADSLTEDLTALLLQLGGELLQAKAHNQALEQRVVQLQQEQQQAMWAAGSALGGRGSAGVLTHNDLPELLRARSATSSGVTPPATPRLQLPTASSAAAAALAGGGASAAVAAAMGQPAWRQAAAVAAIECDAARASSQARLSGSGGSGSGSSSSSGCSTHSRLDEVLLQSDGLQEQQLQRRSQVVTDRLKSLYFTQAVHYANVLTKRQLAALCVHSHPFVPDFICLSEAFEGL